MLNKMKGACHSLKQKLLVMMITVFVTVLSLNGYIYASNITVSINVDGKTVATTESEITTVENILAGQAIDIAAGDFVSPTIDTRLVTDATISVQRLKQITVMNGDEVYSIETLALTTDELSRALVAGMKQGDKLVDAATGIGGDVVMGGVYRVVPAFEVNVYADYARYPVSIAEGTVDDAIRLAGIWVNPDDVIAPTRETALYPGMEIRVYRVCISQTEETEEIPFDTEYRVNHYLSPGQEVVTVEGVNGSVQKKVTVTSYDGVEVVRDEEILASTPAVNKIVECGVWNVKNKNYNDGEIAGVVGGYAYSRVISAKATAYCDHGKTASGIQSKVGVVAVDPRVIPLGTRLYIESADGSWNYGVCLAGDTGGLIKGNRVDLFYNTYGECIQFGRRACNIYVLCD